MNLANRLHSFRVGSDLGSSDRSMPDFSGTLGASMRPGRRRWSEHDLKHGLLVQLRRRSTGRDSRRRYGLELVGLFPFIRSQQLVCRRRLCLSRYLARARGRGTAAISTWSKESQIHRSWPVAAAAVPVAAVAGIAPVVCRVARATDRLSLRCNKVFYQRRQLAKRKRHIS